jgi:hypothetical protein
MKIVRSILPDITIVLNICLLVVIYLDMRNPMMGFLMDAPFQVLAGSCCLSSIATAVILYADKRRSAKAREMSRKKVDLGLKSE